MPTLKPNIDIYPASTPQLPRRQITTEHDTSSAGTSAATNDPYATLASLYAATFGIGSDGARGSDQLAAQVVPVQTGQAQGGNLTGLLVLGLIVAAGWYWWRHRKGATAHA